MNLSQRERYWALAASAFLIFFAYWTLILDPILSRAALLRLDSVQLKAKIERLSRPQASAIQPDKKARIYPRQEQLALVVGFVESKLKESKLELLSLKQISADNKISIEIQTEGPYQNSVVFFEELSELDTVFDVDSVHMANKNKKILTRVRILTPFL